MTARTRRSSWIVLLVLFLVAGAGLAAVGSVTRKAGLDGAFGYQVRSDGKEDPAYVQTNQLGKARAVRVSWLGTGKRLRFAAGTPVGTRVVIARAVTGTNIEKLKKARWEVSLDKTSGSDTPALTLRVYEQGRRTTDFDLGPANREAWLEVSWMSARSGGSNDGEMTVLRNGETIVEAAGLDNKARLGAFAIGMLGNAEHIAKNRSIFIDRVWVTHL